MTIAEEIERIYRASDDDRMKQIATIIFKLLPAKAVPIETRLSELRNHSTLLNVR